MIIDVVDSRPCGDIKVGGAGAGIMGGGTGALCQQQLCAPPPMPSVISCCLSTPYGALAALVISS